MVGDGVGAGVGNGVGNGVGSGVGNGVGTCRCCMVREQMIVSALHSDNVGKYESVLEVPMAPFNTCDELQ